MKTLAGVILYTPPEFMTEEDKDPVEMVSLNKLKPTSIPHFLDKEERLSKEKRAELRPLEWKAGATAHSYIICRVEGGNTYALNVLVHL